LIAVTSPTTRRGEGRKNSRTRGRLGNVVELLLKRANIRVRGGNYLTEARVTGKKR